MDGHGFDGQTGAVKGKPCRWQGCGHGEKWTVCLTCILRWSVRCFELVWSWERGLGNNRPSERYILIRRCRELTRLPNLQWRTISMIWGNSWYHRPMVDLGW